jgi:predicted TIM-barrel fold metal-dependent hydrolase
MIIDCHTHINCSSGNADVADHLDACEKVTACIVLASNQSPSEVANIAVAEYVKQNEKMVGFGVFNPLEDPVGHKRQIKALISDMGLAGVVMYCSEAGFHPAHSKALQFYEIAEKLKLPVFFHNCGAMGAGAVMDFARPYLLDEIARSFPGLKMIVGGMGGAFYGETLELVKRHENVYADLTIDPDKMWQTYNFVISAYEAGAMDKLLFGSGYPIATPSRCAEVLLGFNRLMADTSLPTVPREELRAIVERDAFAELGI